ncbi:MAG: hypothetical protein JXA96_08395, partial [Sedimentisphaerales bacterium]|nr:hypothetical protein [Sedimentisphaerales bacterium]
MGSALTDADFGKITGLIRHWCVDRKLALRSDTDPVCNGNEQRQDSILQVGTGFYRIIWRIYKSERGIIIDMDLKPRFYFSLVLNAILFSGLFYCTFLIESLLEDFNVTQMIKLIIASPLVIIYITLKNSRLSLWMAQIEASFWKTAGDKINLEQLTKTSGSISTRRLRFVTELFLVFFAVYICTGMFGILGFLVSSLVCSLFIIMIAAEIIRKDNPHWNWRFWIMGNMARWTLLMLIINGLMFVFFAIDIIIPLQPYKSESIPSVTQVLKTAKMRDIKPATAVNLENDCINCFRAMAENQVNKSHEQSGSDAGQAQTQEINKSLRFNGVAFFVIIILIPVYFFSVRPFRSLLKTQRIWAAEVTSNLKQPEPFVPYISRSWKIRTPAVLRMLIFLHGIVGGIINITAVVLCVDGWSYLLIGRPLLIEKSANIWSWPFAVSKITFGENAGQIAGTLILISI